MGRGRKGLLLNYPGPLGTNDSIMLSLMPRGRRWWMSFHISTKRLVRLFSIWHLLWQFKFSLIHFLTFFSFHLLFLGLWHDSHASILSCEIKATEVTLTAVKLYLFSIYFRITKLTGRIQRYTLNISRENPRQDSLLVYYIVLIYLHTTRYPT